MGSTLEDVTKEYNDAVTQFDKGMTSLHICDGNGNITSSSDVFKLDADDIVTLQCLLAREMNTTRITLFENNFISMRAGDGIFVGRGNFNVDTSETVSSPNTNKRHTVEEKMIANYLARGRVIVAGCTCGEFTVVAMGVASKHDAVMGLASRRGSVLELVKDVRRKLLVSHG